MIHIVLNTIRPRLLTLLLFFRGVQKPILANSDHFYRQNINSKSVILNWQFESSVRILLS